MSQNVQLNKTEFSPQRLRVIDKSIYQAREPDFTGISDTYEVKKKGNRLVYSPKPRSPLRSYLSSPGRG